MLTLIDVTGVTLPEPNFLQDLVERFSKANHPNLLNLKSKAIMLNDVQTLVLRTDSPDHISTWK